LVGVGCAASVAAAGVDVCGGCWFHAGEQNSTFSILTQSRPTGVTSAHLPSTWRGFPEAGVGNFLQRPVRLSRRQLE
jgi:hypothetical protein